MSIRSRLASLFSRKVEPMDPAYGAAPWPLMYVPSELRLQQDEMMSLSVAWACIRVLVDSLASLEIKVLTREAGRRLQLVDDPVSWMLNVRPNPDMTAQAAKEILITQALIDGDGYGYIVRDRAFRAAELWPLDSRFMQAERRGDELVYLYDDPASGKRVELEAYDVYHLRGPSLRGLFGDSSLYRASKSIALGVAQERYATSYYANGAVPGAVLKPPASAVVQSDARDRMRQEWRKRHAGAKRGNSLATLEPGWDLVVVDNDPSKSQVVPSRQFSTEEIARHFGVPLVLLGVQAAAQGYGTNVSQLYLVFARNTLLPWTNRITEEGQFKFFPDRKPWRELEMDLSPLLKGDELQQAQAAEIWIRSSLKTPNEGRADINLNGYGPDGDKPLAQNSLTTLERVLNPPAPPPAFAPAAPAEDPEEDAQDPAEPADPADDPAEDGAEALAAGVRAELEQHARRVRARRADLVRAGKSPEEIAANLERLHQRHAAGVLVALASLEHVEPDVAASHLAAGLTGKKAP